MRMITLLFPLLEQLLLFSTAVSRVIYRSKSYFASKARAIVVSRATSRASKAIYISAAGQAFLLLKLFYRS